MSESVAHPALVTEALFVSAQQVRAARLTGDGEQRRYLLAGLVQCGVCGRRLDSHWVHGRAGYRCRPGRSSAHPQMLDQLKSIYVREDVLVRELISRLQPGREADHLTVVARTEASLRETER